MKYLLRSKHQGQGWAEEECSHGFKHTKEEAEAWVATQQAKDDDPCTRYYYKEVESFRRFRSKNIDGRIVMWMETIR